MEISRNQIMPRTSKTCYIFIRVRIVHPHKMVFSGFIIKLEIFQLLLFLNSHQLIFVFVFFFAPLILLTVDFINWDTGTNILILIRHLNRAGQIWIFARRNSMITVDLKFLNYLVLIFILLKAKKLISMIFLVWWSILIL